MDQEKKEFLNNYFDSLLSTPEEQLKNEPVWKTADGRSIRIKDMETTHLLNSIAILRKREGYRDKGFLTTLEYMVKELESRNPLEYAIKSTLDVFEDIIKKKED
jgi:hypothetical protein